MRILISSFSWDLDSVETYMLVMFMMGGYEESVTVPSIHIAD